MKTKYQIEDEFGNVCFSGKTFNAYEDGWGFLYVTYPVIKHDDGTQDDRDDILDSFYVVKTTNKN
jgi:hypothetical protein